jgi:hypothetical protein
MWVFLAGNHRRHAHLVDGRRSTTLLMRLSKLLVPERRSSFALGPMVIDEDEAFDLVTGYLQKAGA